jgi:hypothetical protein
MTFGLLGLSIVLSAAPAKPGAPAPTVPRADAGEAAPSAPVAPKLKCLASQELCVTHGVITRGINGGFSISDPEVRAVSAIGISRTAELRFKYLGRTSRAKPLASGQIRQQAGVKLRAKDGCNVVYAIWRFDPKNELVVSVKSNPGKSTHAQCGAKGYTNIPALRATPIPEIKPGDSHVLRAELLGDTDALRVFIDEALVWEGALGPTALEFDGPAGLRTDTVRLEADFCQTTQVPGSQFQAPRTRCIEAQQAGSD